MTVGSGSPSKLPLQLDHNLETDFAKLVTAIDSERERFQAAWFSLNDQRDRDLEALERKREETAEWIESEKEKIARAWADVNDVRRALDAYLEPDEDVFFNCAGTIFQIQKSCLANSNSLLNQMMGEEAGPKIPRDEEGRFKVDFNPTCFGLLLDWLRAKASSKSVPPPVVPLEQRMNMDSLCDELRVLDIHPPNTVQNPHQTSLTVTPDTIASTMEGWQVISAQYPLRLSKKSYFEIKLEAITNPKGGCAVGIMGHVPAGKEVYQLHQKDALLYNSGNGLVKTEACGLTDISTDKANAALFKESSTIGVLYDPARYSVTWFLNKTNIGSAAVQSEYHDKMQFPVPAFALFEAGTRVKINFNAEPPSEDT